jgi:hypothetical protein
VSCNISNNELFLGQYIGPQFATSSLYYNHGIYGDFYKTNYYYHSSWLNENHTMYRIHENCQQYKVINQEWSNNVSFNSIKEYRTYGYHMGLGIWVTHEITTFYLSAGEILDYLEEFISSLESQFDITYDNIMQEDLESFWDLILGFIPGADIYMYTFNVLEHAYEAQIHSLGNTMGSLLDVLSNEPNKILKLTMDYKIQTGGSPTITRSYEILDSIDPITYYKTINTREIELSGLDYFSYDFNNTYNLLDQYAVNYLSVITVIDS